MTKQQEENTLLFSATPETQPCFPFAAIVDQEQAKEALLMAVINPAVHGVLFLGEKGSGKTTLVRSLCSLLPERKVIELPLGSGEEMVLGTVDAEKAVATGRVEVTPGILTRADGHVLYIDEVNLLADHLVDVILDAAATGQYHLEREGISAHYPARFILVGSMNPEEGWLRPQLLDRFGLAVRVGALSSIADRTEVFRCSQAFARDPKRFVQRYADQQISLTSQLLAARDRLSRVEVPEDLTKRTIETILKLEVRTHRAEITALEGAVARAAWHGRDRVEWTDVQQVIPLALQHRLSETDTQRPLSWDSLEKKALEVDRRSKRDDDQGWFPTPFFRKKKEQ
jgi:Mg-chelatase subunit ChlI